MKPKMKLQKSSIILITKFISGDTIIISIIIVIIIISVINFILLQNKNFSIFYPKKKKFCFYCICVSVMTEYEMLFMSFFWDDTSLECKKSFSSHLYGTVFLDFLQINGWI